MSVQYVKCSYCNGTGKVTGGGYSGSIECDACKGSGSKEIPVIKVKRRKIIQEEKTANVS